MPSNQKNPATFETVPTLQHEIGNWRKNSWQGKINTINNRRFAFWHKDSETDLLVEIVRKGKNTTRIREDLENNAVSLVVRTDQLFNFHFRDELEPKTDPTYS